MPRRVLLVLTLLLIIAYFGTPAFSQQDETPPAQDQAQDSPRQPDDSAARAREAEVSSSKDTRIDLSPPKDDAKNHPESGVAIMDSEEQAPSEIDEMHPWDPHKAAKDIEVGDYYFKRKNYHGALERYKDALVYKPDDAIAHFRLAECEEKTNNPSEAIQHYETYLKILPHGPFAADAQKALERLKTSAKAGENSSK